MATLFDEEEEEEEPFIPLTYGDFVPYPTTARQDEVIRAYARKEGYETLRGFHFFLRREGMEYYDILAEESP